MELRRMGVPEEAAQAALAELEEEQQDDGAAALARKFLRRYAGESPADARRKSIAALLRRGYAYGEAARACRAAMEEAEE
jgi:regulatory protein